MSTMNQMGIYVAYPTTDLLQSIYKPKNYKTKVNDQHTKVGITIKNFKQRSKCYFDNFGNKFVFKPLFVLKNQEEIKAVEKVILKRLKEIYSKSGSAREWFHTVERQNIVQEIEQILVAKNINYKTI